MKGKLQLLLILVILCILPLQARREKGNGNIITRSVSVGEYDGVEVGGQIEGQNGVGWLGWFSKGDGPAYVFNYSQGNAASLKVTIDENLYPFLDIRVKEGRLVVRTKDDTRIQPTELKFEGVSKKLESLRISGCIDFALQTPLSGDQLSVRSSGGSDVYMKQPVRMTFCEVHASGGSDVVFDDLECTEFASGTSGGSDLDLKGKADKAEFRSSGGSDIDAYGFHVKDLRCRASGGSDIYAYATEHLDAAASGGSDIHYKGPAQVTSSESGGSDVSKAD